MSVFFDTHAHLDYPDFAADLPEVLERAKVAGITRIISIGTDFESSRRAISLAERFPEIYAVAGWHPCEVLQAPEDVRAELRVLAAHPKVVALGETGLDHHRLPSAEAGGNEVADAPYKKKQENLFQQHLEVAAESGLNCVIHQRDAFEQTLALLEKFSGRVRGVFHCFANDALAQLRIQRLGSIVSFTGIITFKNAELIRQTVAATPLGQFMLETDCPYLAPVPYRGKRCEPAYVGEIARAVAKIKECDAAALSEATCATARNFFRRLT